MRAVQVLDLVGPDGVQVAQTAKPTHSDDSVLVDVHAVGVAFPDLLLSKGQYQITPDPPFTLGTEFAGTALSGTNAGQRVVGLIPFGACAERIAVPAQCLLPLPQGTSFTHGAALPMNYLTAVFCLIDRAQVRPGETVLVHGAAGGVGTASLQVARGLGARTIAVVSTPAKAEVARSAGADEVVLADGFRAAVADLTQGRGVDVVVDVVGGHLFIDSLRALAPFGRLMVVGFAAGQGIPEVKVNRLLLNNIDVRGVGMGAYLGVVGLQQMRSWWDVIVPMLAEGVIAPPVTATYPMEGYSDALRALDSRTAAGKLVVAVSPPD